MAATILKKRSNWWILAVVALVASAFILWWTAAKSSAEFPVTLLTVTGDPKQGQLATFKVTNDSEATILGQVFPPQLKSRGTWSQLQMPPSGKWFWLTAGRAYNFSIAAPTNACEWRVPVRWNYRSSVGFRRIIGMLKLNLEANWNTLRQGAGIRFIPGVEVKVNMSYSTVITNRG